MDNHLIRYDSFAGNWEIWVASQPSAGNRKNIMIGGTTQKAQDRWDGPIFAALYWHRKLGSEDALWLHNHYRKLQGIRRILVPMTAAAVVEELGPETTVFVTDVNTTESWNDGDTGLPITGTGFV